MVEFFGVSTGFFSSGMSTRFTLLVGSDVLVLPGATGVVFKGGAVAAAD